MGSERIAVIGGGNMGEALAGGMVSAGYASQESIIVAEPFEARREYLVSKGYRTVASGPEAVREAEVVLFAVKPQILGEVLESLKEDVTAEKLLVSIVAGATTTRFTDIFGNDARIVRVMPNTPALVGAGAAAVCAGGAASEEDLATARVMLESVGLAVEVPESQMDAVTGLSGSGPAYVFQFIEAMADGGVCAGLPRDKALMLAAQTVQGAARMVLELNEHPGRLKDMVASPGGTTIAGLHAMEKGGLRAAVIDAIMAATNRSAELGKG
ncbi:MAG: pyrroline-5-carboxylate reductase [Nitrospinaceae bacterium]|mgnify:CR=1 FL=1|nr:pyrroline-5-carboxylate reductase [Nitrospinaceae bacterium]MBT3433411.1 pyrroline-5-carboxylate reductase [Nitrospinaceae bacterium]MBT4093108.1 pyrroline-5-carboxylate reductase [Nitrospinaceae bacterium]MBT4429368.1 pyrroline-5-carboxylate reductase [Nitrospinaceae bacterium]MBT5367563.1 pyrroline-5-carboxylate reductase [Nitrospinaceae bacterium]